MELELNVSEIASEIQYQRPWQVIVEDLLIVTFYLLAIVSVFLIIFIIMNYKKLNTITNTYVINFVTAFGLFVILNPEIYHFLGLPYGLGYIFQSLWIFSLGLTYLFAAVLAVDWFMATFFPNKSKCLRKQYKYISVFLWVIFTISCLTFHLFLDLYGFFSLYIPYILFLIVCKVIVVLMGFIFVVTKCRKKTGDTETHGILIALEYNIAMLFSLLVMFKSYYIGGYLMFYLSIIINLISLVYTDTDFRDCFLKTVKCVAIPRIYAYARFRKGDHEDDERLCSSIENV